MKLKNKRWLSITVGSLVTLCIITLAIGLHPSNMKEKTSLSDSLYKESFKQTFIEKSSVDAPNPANLQTTTASPPKGGIQELPNTKLSDPVILSRLPYTEYEREKQ